MSAGKKGKYERKKQEKEHSTLFYFTISLLLVFAILLGVGMLAFLLQGQAEPRGTISSTQSTAATVANTEKPKEYKSSTVSTEPQKTADDIVTQCVAQVKKNVPEAYKGYTILDTNDGGHVLVISVCYDGFYDAYSVNSSDWRELTNATDELSDSAHKLFVKAGFTNWSVSIMLHNDRNYDRILYTALDGKEYK